MHAQTDLSYARSIENRQMQSDKMGEKMTIQKNTVPLAANGIGSKGIENVISMAHVNQHIPVAPCSIWKVMSVIDEVQVLTRTMLKTQVILVNGKSSQWTVSSAQQLGKLSRDIRRNVAMTKN